MSSTKIKCPNCQIEFEATDAFRDEIQKELRAKASEWQAKKEEEYKKKFMNGFVSDYFQNSYKDLVTFFANEKKISASDLKEIIKLIENPKK